VRRSQLWYWERACRLNSRTTARIKAFAPTPEKPFVLGLPTGSSPEGIYKELVQAHKNGEISFKDVVTFNMVRLVFRLSGNCATNAKMD
jgi:6-phosphogluconolactonase/glucosamine-6-phosphate isomerase/deaminase